MPAAEARRDHVVRAPAHPWAPRHDGAGEEVSGSIIGQRGAPSGQLPSDPAGLADALLSGDEHLRTCVLAAAERCLTKKQLACFRHLLQGVGIEEIARRVGLDHSTVHNHLYGHPTHGGGALRKLRHVLANDEVFMREIEGAPARRMALQERVLSWFHALGPGSMHLFGPLAVLLVADVAADSKRSVSFADLYLYMPRAAIAAAVPFLRGAGFIVTDGVTMTIRKTPIDDVKEAR